MKITVSLVPMDREQQRPFFQMLNVMERKRTLPARYNKDPALGFEPIGEMKRSNPAPAVGSRERSKKRKGISLGKEMPFVLPSENWLAVVNDYRTWLRGGNSIQPLRMSVLAGYPQPEWDDSRTGIRRA